MKMNMETHKPYGPYEKYFKRPIDFFSSIGQISKYLVYGSSNPYTKGKYSFYIYEIVH